MKGRVVPPPTAPRKPRWIVRNPEKPHRKEPEPQKSPDAFKYDVNIVERPQ